MSVDWDEPRQVRKTSHQVGEELGRLSADELRERRALLVAEIERLEAELARKETSLAAAQGVFTSGGGY